MKKMDIQQVMKAIEKEGFWSGWMVPEGMPQGIMKTHFPSKNQARIIYGAMQDYHKKDITLYED